MCVFSFFCALCVSLSCEEFSKLSPFWILRLFSSSSSVVIVAESFREEKAAPSGIFIHVFEFSKRFSIVPAMTTLVETSEEEPTLAVARAIAEIAWSQGGADVSPFSLLRQLWLIERGYGL